MHRDQENGNKSERLLGEAARALDYEGVVLFTPSELSGMVKRHPRTLERWRAQGRGPGWIEEAGAIWYPADEFRAWRLLKLAARIDHSVACPGCGALLPGATP